MSYRDQVKPWFETGDYPDQEQFYSFFEWIRFKDEPLTLAEVTGLIDQLNSLGQLPDEVQSTGDDIVYTVPAGYLLTNIAWQSNTPANPSCEHENSLTPDDIMIPADANKLKDVWNIGVFAVGADENIVVKNMPTGSKVFFIRKKLL